MCFQGNRTVGISEKPTPAFLNRLKEVFGFEPLLTMGMMRCRRPGHDRRSGKSAYLPRR